MFIIKSVHFYDTVFYMLPINPVPSFAVFRENDGIWIITTYFERGIRIRFAGLTISCRRALMKETVDGEVKLPTAPTEIREG